MRDGFHLRIAENCSMISVIGKKIRKGNFTVTSDVSKEAEQAEVTTEDKANAL